MTAARAAIVDAYSSGALFAPAFAERGHECVAIHSRRAIPELFRASFVPSDFAAILDAEDDLAATAAELERLGVRWVLAGSEPGVELADELSDRLGLAANGPAQRAARRDKHLMGEAVRAYGLRTPAQFRSSRLGELQSWTRSHGEWPVVAKPLRSVASDSVTVCHSEEALARAYDAIAGRTNVLDATNDGVLVQELVDGQEYVVDTVSYEGHHRVAAFWRYHPPRCDVAGVFYDAIELLPYEGERQEALLASAVDVLDALEIRYGPAHTELMWADGEGPTFVETGARLSAGNNATLSRLCGGPCALDLTIEACLDPQRFLAPMPPPQLTAVAMNCFLIPPERQWVRAQPPLDEIRRLTSFHRVSIASEPRRHPVAGVVTLVHPDRRVVCDDVERLRELERTRLYEPTAAAVVA